MVIVKFIKQKKYEYIINENITFSELRVLDEKDKMLGVLKLEDAIKLSNEKGLDLVVITDKANPPVAKIIDYKKFIYEKEKQKKEDKKKQKIVVIKEIKIRFKIGINDLNIKIKNMIKFLLSGDKVKVSVLFFGREMEKINDGKKILNKVIEATKEYSEIEKGPITMGNQIVLILASKIKTK